MQQIKLLAHQIHPDLHLMVSFIDFMNFISEFYYQFHFSIKSFVSYSRDIENVYIFFIDALDSKFSDESEDGGDEGITGPERTYKGPHLTFPLQKKDIDILINLFRKKKVTTSKNFIETFLFLNFPSIIVFTPNM